MLTSIFTQSSYRDFLREHIKHLPRKGRGALGQIASRIGVHSTYISLVMRGDRDLSQEQAFALADYLQLSDLETDYFCLLVQLERAGNQNYKKYLKEKIKKIQTESQKLSLRFDHERILTDEQKSTFYSSWIYSAIRLYCSTKETGRRPEELVARFGLSRKKVVEALNFLVDAGLVEIKNGLFCMGPQRTFIEFGSPHLLKHHSNWRIKALQRSENLEEEELMFTSPMSLSKRDFTRIRDALAETLKTVSPIIKDSPAEEIACLNMDFFWVER